MFPRSQVIYKINSHDLLSPLVLNFYLNSSSLVYTKLSEVILELADNEKFINPLIEP